MPSKAPMFQEEALSPEWLSWALSQGGEPVEVTGVDVVEILGPSATKIRFVADYAGTPPEGLPKELCMKGIFNPAMHTYYLKAGTQVAETGYFSYVAPNVTVNSPPALYSGLDEETLQGVVIMPDLTATGTKFLTALSAYTPEQARGSLDQLARLHGGTWGKVEQYAFTETKMDKLVDFDQVPPAKLTQMLHDPRGEPLPEWARSGERLNEAMRKLSRLVTAPELCLVHGDAHAGNVYENADGSIGLIDWQVLGRGHWSYDVGYHIAAALDVEDRRRSEQDLLRYYLEKLKEYGGNPPSWDEAWRFYREAITYGFFMWGITQRVDPKITYRFVERCGTAVVDHDTYGLLGV